MNYSEKRLRRGLALVRIVMGLMYICYGYEKLFDASFFENGFMQRLAIWETAVASWYEWMWQILAAHPGRWAIFFGSLEMFIGVALLFGLATRPACALGMIYALNRVALTWYPDDMPFQLWRFLELHFGQIAILGLFLLMGLGHAGDIWGLGAVYHRIRLRLGPVRRRTSQFGDFDSELESEILPAEEFESEPVSHDRAS